MHAAPHAAMAPSDAVSATRRCRSISTSITLVLILVYIPRWLYQPTDMLRYVRRSIPHPSMAPSVQLRGSLQRKRICTDQEIHATSRVQAHARAPPRTLGARITKSVATRCSRACVRVRTLPPPAREAYPPTIHTSSLNRQSLAFPIIYVRPGPFCRAMSIATTRGQGYPQSPLYNFPAQC